MPRELNRQKLQDGGAIVVYDWMEVPGGDNLVRLDKRGTVVWRPLPPAPTTFKKDFWTSFLEISDYTLRAYSWSGSLCTLDMRSGKILSQEFVK